MLRRLDIRTRRAVRNAHIAWATWSTRAGAAISHPDMPDRVMYSLGLAVLVMLFAGVFE